MALLKAGVVGCGAFGRYHAAKYAHNPNTELVALFDSSLDDAQNLAEQWGGEAFTDYAEFLAQVDIVTIALPARFHFESARKALWADKSVFIEKPIAATVEQAEALLDLADRGGKVIGVGHQERVIAKVIGLLDCAETPVSIEAVRYGVWSGRGTDVSVTLDLMTHDLDVVLSILAGAEISRLKAQGHKERSKEIDEMHANLCFSNGAAVNLHASRLKAERERWMKVVYPSGELFVDFITRETRNTSRNHFNLEFAADPRVKDSLGYNLGTFIETVVGSRAEPLVTGADGLRALTVAQRLDNAIGDLV